MMNKFVALSVLLCSGLAAVRFGAPFSSVSEPGALVLFGAGLAILATISRRREVAIATPSN
jgi:hypothetical protein